MKKLEHALHYNNAWFSEGWKGRRKDVVVSKKDQDAAEERVASRKAAIVAMLQELRGLNADHPRVRGVPACWVR